MLAQVSEDLYSRTTGGVKMVGKLKLHALMHKETTVTRNMLT